MDASSPAAERLATGQRVVLALFALVLLLFTKDEPGSWADGSRLGTIQALVEHGTLQLDETDYLWQGDKIQVDGHFYSHQPPMLAVLGAVPYAALHLAGRAIDDAHTYRVLTWVLVGLPLLLGLRALGLLLRRAGCGDLWSTAILLLACFGTLVLPYALVLNQHGTAAGLVLLALGAIAARRPMTAGVLLSLAGTIDMTALFAAFACLLPVWRLGGAQALARTVLGALPPLALHAGINLAVVGDLVPFALHLEAFRYPLSPFLLMSLTGAGEEDPAGTQALYLWRASFGQSGLFSHHPVLLLALAAGVALAFRRRAGVARHDASAPGLPPGMLAAVALFSAGIAGYYLTQSRNLGGSAFGVRWFTVFSPALALFPAAWIGSRPPGWRASPGLFGLVAAAGLWSIAASALGAVQPWTKFAYFWDQRPESLITDPDTPVPSWGEHLRREWARVRNWRQPFEERYFVNTYVVMLNRHGRLRLREWPGMTPAQREQWVRDGIAKLHEIVDVLRQGGDRSRAHAAAWFWLGKLHKRLGERVEARRAFQEAVNLDPDDGAARLQLEKLEQGE